MADSFLGDIAGSVGETVRGLTPGLSDAFKDVNTQLSDVLGPLMQNVAGSALTVTAELSEEQSEAGVEVMDATVDADETVAATPVQLDMNALDDVSAKLSALEDQALAKLASSDPASQLEGQLELVQVQQMTETIAQALQQAGDAERQAIDGLQVDADMVDADTVDEATAGIADVDGTIVVLGTHDVEDADGVPVSASTSGSAADDAPTDDTTE